MNDVITGAYGMEANLRQKGLLNKSKSTGEGLLIESRGRSEKRGDKSNNRKGRSKSKGKGRSKSRPRDNSNSKGCWICGSEKHWKRDCPDRKKTNDNNNKGHCSANITMCLPETSAFVASLIAKAEEWVMDSGCTFHMTPNREILSDFKELGGNQVLMGNDTSCEVKGIGCITINNQNGSRLVLKDVRYMPEMSRNLISYGQLEQAGCHYIGKDFKVTFYKGDKEIMVGEYHNGLYYPQGNVEKPKANVTKEKLDDTQKWHRRLAHMNQRSMETLVKKGYLKKEEIKTVGFCEACTLGKAHKLSFKKAQRTSESVLDYIHSDLWGSPNVTPSIAGSQYFITFIDDFSKKTWIYFLKTKDEAF